ncbi:hypothetical protein V6N13_107039 [Hibiscus sabdariffa]
MKLAFTLVAPKENLHWSIGNGESVDSWFDSWVSDIGPLVHQLLPSMDPNVPRVSVVSMADHNGDWKCGTLNRFLVKTAYEVRSAVTPIDTNNVWRVIHKHRGLQPLLRLWIMFSANVLLRLQFGVPLLDLIRANWGILFGVLVWNFWKTRNALVFNSPIDGDDSILERSRRLRNVAIRALALRQCGSTASNPIRSGNTIVDSLVKAPTYNGFNVFYYSMPPPFVLESCSN